MRLKKGGFGHKLAKREREGSSMVRNRRNKEMDGKIYKKHNLRKKQGPKEKVGNVKGQHFFGDMMDTYGLIDLWTLM